MHSYWDGGYSRCLVNGAIASCLPKHLRVVQSDGIVGDTEYNRICASYGRSPNALQSESSLSEGRLACLCTRSTTRTDLVYLPFDDDTFQYGLEAVLSRFPKPAWEDRKPIAFWRGGASGFDRPSLRLRVALALASHPHSDVRITPWGGWESGQGVPSELFAPRCSIEDHLRHKYLLVVDGNCIASNHQWVFGSGSVPVMVTHPDNQYWFQPFLRPMVHYVPVQYDLSDLQERIDWLVSHDTEAKQIAEAALAFSREVFSPEFQRTYLIAHTSTATSPSSEEGQDS